MSDINLLGSDVPETASSEQRPAEQAAPSSSNGAAPRRRAGLSGMVLADLRKLASELGISGTAGIRKSDLILAIKERQGAVPRQRHADADQLPLDSVTPKPAGPQPQGPQPQGPQPQGTVPPAGIEAAAQPATQAEEQQVAPPATLIGDQQDQQDRSPQERDTDGADRSRGRRRRPVRANDAPRPQSESRPLSEPRPQSEQTAASDQTSTGQSSGQNGVQSSGGPNGTRDDDDDGGRRRGRRFRDRNRRNRNERGSDRRDSGELEVREDDVLLPVAGILDVLDNYAFVRTSGYLSGPNDVYVSLSLVRKHWLRRGDAITGAVRQPREGEQQRQKFNPLVRVDTINGLDVEQAK
ncbi:MAG: Rho termination factor N-terminal domain-containing protein, partial [Pseudonocardiaceae bacterium]